MRVTGDGGGEEDGGDGPMIGPVELARMFLGEGVIGWGGEVSKGGLGRAGAQMELAGGAFASGQGNLPLDNQSVIAVGKSGRNPKTISCGTALLYKARLPPPHRATITGGSSLARPPRRMVQRSRHGTPSGTLGK
jgi:hypothetical protein